MATPPTLSLRENTMNNLIARAKALGEMALNRIKTDRVMQRALLVALMLGMASVASAAQADTGGVDAITTALESNVTPYLKLGIRLFGGMVALGGFVVGFNGFTGRDEGFDKVFKIGVGFVGIALGIVCIGNTPAIITWLNLDSAFSAT